MDVIFNNAEIEFQRVLDSMGQSPAAWQNWHCLHIEARELEDFKFNPDLMAFAEAMMDCYLQDYEGSVYFCGYQDMYLLAHSIERESLHEIADQLCGSLLFEKSARARKTIYNLSSETLELIYTLCGKGRLFKVAATPHMPDIPFQDTDRVRPDARKAQEPRVLLVEDDESTRWIVRKALKGVCDFTTARDLASGQDKILSYRPHLIFLDINLPDGSGLEILDWITDKNITSDVVIFSSHNTMDNISIAMGAGAKGFISKPFAKSHLIEYVQDCKAN